MPKVVPGRVTHQHTGELVVFLIGMRFNRAWRVDTWLPVFRAMPKMLAELSRHRHLGLLGYRMTLGSGGPVLVQYWESAEKLYAYAGAADAEHRPAWAAFNRQVRRVPGAVGIWHETFQIARAESVYVDMPPTGLALATAAVPVERRSEQARQRLADGATSPQHQAA